MQHRLSPAPGSAGKSWFRSNTQTPRAAPRLGRSPTDRSTRDSSPGCAVWLPPAVAQTRDRPDWAKVAPSRLLPGKVQSVDEVLVFKRGSQPVLQRDFEQTRRFLIERADDIQTNSVDAGLPELDCLAHIVDG